MVRLCRREHGLRTLFLAFAVLISSRAWAQAPNGWIQDSAWLLLGPLGNADGCDPGGAMLSNWIAPLDIASLNPSAGDEEDIDFDLAASTSCG